MKVALAYSGGLDTTVSIPWLKEKYGADVITVTVDVGQSEDFREVEERALSAGASKHFFIDAKDEFVRHYIEPCIKANGLYEDEYPLGTALARPLIASKVVEVALREGCDAVAHGCTGKGNDQLRFDTTISVLAPDLKIIAPIREWDLSRDEEIEYAKSRGLKLDYRQSRFSIDENLWSRSIEAAELEDPWAKPPYEAFKYVVDPVGAPDRVEVLDIDFERGVPVGLNGSDMSLRELVQELNVLGGKSGFGVIDHIEDRAVGIKSREVYEAPAALLLIKAHKDLEKITLNSKTLSFKALVERVWSQMVYQGFWLDPLMEALNAFIDKTQENVTGRVRLELYKGSARVVGRVAENPLYSHEIATYARGSVFQQKAGEGFSKIWGLDTVISARRRRKGKTV
ncbi:MAG: argininosuccinate synthase [Nitrososphaerota archaeon]|nr:argininosuccinate synthase [Candidatus Calditenuaceae archaeon]MDW8073137.1 argininosuccinate synthase [Nitrososphaerota archaeon]